MTAMTIRYAIEPTLAVDEFCRVLVDSGLGAIRPVDDPARLQRMLDAADVIVTARNPDGTLVGVARGITDFAWCCLLPELAVAVAAQGHGVGTHLLAEVRRHLGPQVAVVLASVPTATGFYERTGMERVPDVFWYRRER